MCLRIELQKAQLHMHNPQAEVKTPSTLHLIKHSYLVVSASLNRNIYDNKNMARQDKNPGC